MRKYIFISLILTALCASALFYVSQKTRDAREEIAHIKGDIEQEQESIRVLKAEWSYLNRPQRLEELATKYLEIEKTRPHQFIKLAGLKEDEKTLPVVTPEEKALAQQQAKQLAAKNLKQKAAEAAAAANNNKSSDDDDNTNNNETAEAQGKVAKSGDRSFSALIKAWGND